MNDVILDSVVATNRLRSLSWPLDQYLNQTLCLAAEHPYLVPELDAANAHVIRALDAIASAMEVVKARMEVEAA